MENLSLSRLLLYLSFFAIIPECQFQKSKRYIDSKSPHGGVTSMKLLAPYLSTEELIRARGYPLEIHDIRTEDDYILTVFRIPHGKGKDEDKVPAKQPVYLLHGSAQSSADWLINLDQDNCLPCLIADAGFDVWIGNIRGTVHASRHARLSNHQTIFWNFSIDELAKYDLPNTIDYILSLTGKPRLHYIGFSLGNTIFYMTMSSKPEYNDKIGVHISISPVVFFQTFPAIAHFFAIFTKPLEVLQKATGGFPVPPQGITFMLNQLLSLICSQHIFKGICIQIFLLFGFGPRHSVEEQIGSIGGHILTPSSLKMFIHILQMAKTDRFCPYDEGPMENLKLYGQTEPPDYPLEKVTAPVAIFFGKGDLYANRKGVDRLAKRISNLLEFNTVPIQDFTHLDFFHATHATDLVYNHTINLLRRFSY